MCEAEAGGERLWLLPQRAAFWVRTRTLLVADVHLGKAAAWRRAGVPVPAGTTGSDLDGLSRLLHALAVRRLVFLGDLVHDRSALQAASAAVARWCARHAGVEMLLVRGNHDLRAGEMPATWSMRSVADPLLCDGIALVHQPRAVEGAYAIGGHVHPAVRLIGPGRQHLRAPCFVLTPTHAVLPAYGGFTGMADVLPAAGQRLYVAAGKAVLALPPSRYDGC